MAWNYRTELVRLRERGTAATHSALKLSEVTDLCNRLGADDWELVSAVDTNDYQGQSAHLVLLFKRRAPTP